MRMFILCIGWVIIIFTIVVVSFFLTKMNDWLSSIQMGPYKLLMVALVIDYYLEQMSNSFL
jgi:hypothetical protein